MTTRLQQLRQLEQTAQPPPWTISRVGLAIHFPEPPMRQDAELVIAMRNAIPHLLHLADYAQTWHQAHCGCHGEDCPAGEALAALDHKETQ